MLPKMRRFTQVVRGAATAAVVAHRNEAAAAAVAVPRVVAQHDKIRHRCVEAAKLANGSGRL